MHPVAIYAPLSAMASSKKGSQLNVRVPDEHLEVLKKIEESHSITDDAMVQSFIEQVVEFYRANGFFYMPFKIVIELPGQKKWKR